MSNDYSNPSLLNPSLPEPHVVQEGFDFLKPSHAIHIERYLYLTKSVMPTLAKTTQTDWPVHNDHCFQRIVLDTICGGPWHNKIIRPAYQHLSETQAIQAAQLCEEIINNKVDLNSLNRQSLIWRHKTDAN
ncbi:hypothetical protein [Polynucleobacter antarcticus]|nr:hypothetical protein [Polynucleobacter antarcticus]